MLPAVEGHSHGTGMCQVEPQEECSSGVPVASEVLAEPEGPVTLHRPMDRYILAARVDSTASPGQGILLETVHQSFLGTARNCRSSQLPAAG